MTWFKRLVGFSERNPDQVREILEVEAEILTSRINGESFRVGKLETPSLAELRKATDPILDRGGEPTTVEEVIADVQQLHQSPSCNGAMFQVASQFNLLEMVGPGVTPEMGVGIYENDRTQGPACAIACGAATIYRNYFAEIDGQIGQSKAKQIDCLRDLGTALGNVDGSLWEMSNGYALASEEGLKQISKVIEQADEATLDELRSKLRIGLQWNAGVTIGGGSNIVSQSFCSALPVAYSHVYTGLWEPFARLVLEASYEATFRAGLLNRQRAGSAKLFLTLLGGGAFGNRMEWIIDALERTIASMPNSGLEVKVVSYLSPTPELQPLISR